MPRRVLCRKVHNGNVDSRRARAGINKMLISRQHDDYDTTKPTTGEGSRKGARQKFVKLNFARDGEGLLYGPFSEYLVVTGSCYYDRCTYSYTRRHAEWEGTRRVGKYKCARRRPRLIMTMVIMVNTACAVWIRRRRVRGIREV